MNYAYFLIITKQQITIDLSRYDSLVINNDFTLIDENHIVVNNETYEFTYLLFSSDITYTLNINMLLEDNIPVTNYFKETSIENIYFTNEDINDAIESIIEEN